MGLAPTIINDLVPLKEPNNYNSRRKLFFKIPRNETVRSIDIEATTVFDFFFHEKNSKHLKHKQKASNIQPNISINKKASKLTFNQMFLKAKKRLSNIHSNKYRLKSI